MQNKNFVLDGSGKATIISPDVCDAFDLYCGTNTFTFQYADAAGAPVGDASAAQQWSATLFMTRVESMRGKPFGMNKTIGFVVGTAGATVVWRPRCR